jgi:predicted nucleotidyltransferase
MSYGLEETTIKALQAILAHYPQVEQAILYGSRAKGNYRIASDIDLTLVGPQLTLSTLFQIENEVDDLLLPYKIDLSIHHQIENPDVLDHIKRVGVGFYASVDSLNSI